MLHRIFCLALLCCLLPFAPAAYAEPQSDALAHEAIVKFSPGIGLQANALAFGLGSNPVRAALRAVGAAQAHAIGGTTYRVVFQGPDSPAMLVRKLRAVPGVEYAEPNYERQLLRAINDPLAAQQYHLSKIQAPSAWDISIGDGITVAILDTGISRTHPDLQGRLLPGYDLFNDDGDTSDDEGHGTHTAGLIAANGDNSEGGAGVCWHCTLLPIKVLGPRGRGSDAVIAEGIRLAVDQGARVISMSLGGPQESTALREAVEYATSRNVLLVAASGNDGTRGTLVSYPAAFPNVIAVSATTQSDQLASFSTTGDFIDIAAPGTGILSTYWSPNRGDRYATASGTSEAAPQVAGAAALMLTLRPDLNSVQMGEILKASADDVDAPGFDPQTGYGRLNVLRALQMTAAPDVLSRSVIQGQVAGALPDQVTLSLSTGQQTRPDSGGFYRFEALPTGTYNITASLPDGQQSSQQVYVSGTAISIATINFAFGGASVPAPGATTPAPMPSNDPNAVFFPETGFSLGGEFRAYWQAHGGLPVFGYPISEERVEPSDDGQMYVVQYFERNRFELHPDQAAPYNVQLGRLGDTILRQQGRDWFSFPKGSEQPGCRYFAETGHSICGVFLEYWSTHGLELDGRAGKTPAESLALFGLPLSEPQLETFPDGRSYVVQWFERARFEDHGSEGVLLGLLGRELQR